MSEENKVGAFERLYQSIALGEDERPICEVCGTPKYSIQGKGIMDIQRDYVIPALCECEIEKRERIKKQDSLALEKNEKYGRYLYIRSLKESGFVEEKQREYTFENDDDPNDRMSIACRNYAKNWSRFEDTNDGLLLYGSVGTGKTYLACCIANALIDKGVNVKVRKLSTLLNLATFKERADELRSLASVDLLIIDDLGVERATEYALDIVLTLIDDRMNAKKPLIVTTNLTPKQMANEETMALQRIYDRVLQQCPAHLPFKGKSKRHKNRNERISDMSKTLFPDG